MDDWEEKIKEIKDYMEKHGSLNVPPGETPPSFMPWLEKQIRNRKVLSQKKLDAFKEAGIELNPMIQTKLWWKHLDSIQRYQEENPDKNINHIPTTQQIDGFLPYLWLRKQVAKKESLSEKQVNALDSIGFEWGFVNKEQTWWKRYSTVKDYYLKNGNLNFPYKLRMDGFRMKTWLDYNIQNHDKLSEEQIKALDELKIEWKRNTRKDKWWNHFEAVKKFYTDEETKKIRRDTVIDGFHPYAWLRDQIQNKNNLSEEQVKALESIGFKWEINPKKE